MLKNYKSFMAFFLFVIVYGYSAFNFDPSKAISADVIFYTGLFAFFAMALIMSRSDTGTKLIESLIEVIKLKFK